MLIQLLDYLQSGKTYSIQDLADLLNKDTESVRVELKYLEHQGYIRKTIMNSLCSVIWRSIRQIPGMGKSELL